MALSNLVAEEFNRLDDFENLKITKYQKVLKGKKQEVLNYIRANFKEDLQGYFINLFHDTENNALNIDTINISENIQGRGYGRKIVEAIERVAFKLNCLSILVPCPLERAFGFWEHMGYIKKKGFDITYKKPIQSNNL